MRDPKPVAWLLLTQLLALAWLAGWWLNLSPAARMVQLATVAYEEQVVMPVPPGLVAQVTWLWTHRIGRMRGTVALLVVAGVIGLGEGMAKRAAHPLGGFLLTSWTFGVMGL